MPNQSFLGKGMKFPPQINPATGKFVVASEQESVKESVYIILMTGLSERALRPDFGSNLMSYTFMDVNITNISMMRRTIETQLKRQEPRIADVDVQVSPPDNSGRMIININYTIISENVRDNLVFPFYLNIKTEEDEYEPEQMEEATEFED